MSYTEDKELFDVRAFHHKFGQIDSAKPTHLTRRKLAERANFMLEELNEFAKAAGLVAVAINGNVEVVGTIFRFEDCDGDQDMSLQADALVDLVYVAKGTAAMMGLPWAALWDDVQRANMAKVRGQTHRGNAFDVAKPPGWQGPKTLTILRQFGYGVIDFCSLIRGSLRIDDTKCKDDPAEHRATHYISKDAVDALFVKEAAFFVAQGGLKEPWGQTWYPVIATSIGDARRQAAAYFGVPLSAIHRDEP